MISKDLWKRTGSFLAGLLLFLILNACAWTPAALAQISDVSSLEEEQAKEKIELEKMKEEIKGVKSTMSESMQAMGRLGAQLSRPPVREFHLVAKEAVWELFPGNGVEAMTYNGQTPGPVIAVEEGDQVRVVLHNQLKVPTSLYFHGLILPHSVDGLPRQKEGLIGPGESYAYQFVANQPGTFWYHPQVIHAEQQTRGLFGALVVKPRSAAPTYERELTMVIGQFAVVPQSAMMSGTTTKNVRAARTPPGKAAGSGQAPNVVLANIGLLPPAAVTYFTINGKAAPAIPPVDLNKGERVRLRVINAGQQVCPLYLSGHRWQIVAMNGCDLSQDRLVCDSLAIQPGERYDLEFTADNPGVWSLSSLLAAQTTNNGKFPGGIAVVVRYPDSRNSSGR